MYSAVQKSICKIEFRSIARSQRKSFCWFNARFGSLLHFIWLQLCCVCIVCISLFVCVCVRTLRKAPADDEKFRPRICWSTILNVFSPAFVMCTSTSYCCILASRNFWANIALCAGVDCLASVTKGCTEVIV